MTSYFIYIYWAIVVAIGIAFIYDIQRQEGYKEGLIKQIKKGFNDTVDKSKNTFESEADKAKRLAEEEAKRIEEEAKRLADLLEQKTILEFFEKVSGTADKLLESISLANSAITQAITIPASNSRLMRNMVNIRRAVG